MHMKLNKRERLLLQTYFHFKYALPNSLFKMVLEWRVISKMPSYSHFFSRGGSEYSTEQRKHQTSNSPFKLQLQTWNIFMTFQNVFLSWHYCLKDAAWTKNKQILGEGNFVLFFPFDFLKLITVFFNTHYWDCNFNNFNSSYDMKALPHLS